MTVYLRSLWLLAVAGCASAAEGGDDGDDGDGPSPDAAMQTDGSMNPDAALPDAAPSACDVRLTQLAASLDTAAAGWTHAVMDGASAPGWPLDEWQGGQATSGPGSCRTGAHCWATNLSKNYTSCERAELVTPTIDLSPCAGRTINLTFWSWSDFWSGTVSGKPDTWYDGGFVELTGAGSAWQLPTPSPAYPGAVNINPNIGSYACVSQDSFYADGKPGLVGTSAGWQQITIPIPPAALTSTFRARFVFASGVSFADNDAEGNRAHTRPGWYIDDVQLSGP